MKINFDCQKCIHAPVCMFKAEAAREIKDYDNFKDNDTFRLNLNCKYYANISVSKDVVYCK